MAATLPFAENEIRLLTALLRARVRFMIVGLSAATLQGAPVVTQDVDLWFEKLGDLKISRALQTVGAAYVPPSPINPPMLAGAGAELFDIVLRMDGLALLPRSLKIALKFRWATKNSKCFPWNESSPAKLPLIVPKTN